MDEVGGDARLAQVGAAQAAVGERDVDAEVRRARVQPRQEVRRAHVGDHSCAQCESEESLMSPENSATRRTKSVHL